MTGGKRKRREEEREEGGVGSALRFLAPFRSLGCPAGLSVVLCSALALARSARLSVPWSALAGSVAQQRSVPRRAAGGPASLPAPLPPGRHPSVAVAIS